MRRRMAPCVTRCVYLSQPMMTSAPTLAPHQVRDNRISADAAREVYDRLREGQRSAELRTLRQRKTALKRLRKAIKAHERDILEALRLDLRKPEFEAYAAEVGFCYQDIDHTLSHLREWMQAERVAVGLALWPTRAEIRKQPKGVVLVIAPWNYPFQLAIAPLVAAIAAGNSVLLKPAEDTPHTSTVLAQVLAEAFAKTSVAVVQGPGSEVVPVLMEAVRFDHVFYTGSTAVGRKLAAQCGEQLIPCTLELGGKSPCVVFDDAALDSTSDRIAWAKCMNVGQTCVAPDYVLVQRGVFDTFSRKLAEKLNAAYGDDPQSSPDLARIVNAKHFDRLVGLLGDGNVVYGGQHDRDDLFVAPTLLTDVDAESDLLNEEIFGPLLPLIPFDTWEQAKEVIARNPNPLSAYVFTQSDKRAERFIEDLTFGGGCVNDAIIHLGIPELPFGGVQQSGIGSYHARAGFDAFSNTKSVARTSGRINPKTRYAPYRDVYLKAVRWLFG